MPTKRESTAPEQPKARRKARVLTGTASWADPGFTDWYPPDLPVKDRLSYYAGRFNLVEVNTSFYAIPSPKVAEGWAERTPGHFTFDVKLFQYLSRHRTPVERLPRDLRPLAEVKGGKAGLTPVLERQLAARFREAVEPLREAGKLGVLLLQLSPSFSPKGHALAELDDLVGEFEGYDLAVELRHRGWVTGGELEGTREYFRSRRLAYVAVDVPDSEHFMAMPPLDLVTHPKVAYLRAHGRNEQGFLYGKTVEARFDYDYAEEELREVVGRAVGMLRGASEVHVIYNNNKSDYALRAAGRTRELVAEKLPRAAQSR